MPFTFAHPAAVLPLKRFCPRHLSLMGLIVGSVVPDAGYCFTRYNGDLLSHSFVGSFVFCLPAGVIMLLTIYCLRGVVVERLPEHYRRVFLPACHAPIGHPLIIMASILIGAWTHLIWDNCTHPREWLAWKFPIFLTPIIVIGTRTLTISHVLLYVSTFAGVAWTCFEYGRWRLDADTAAPASVRRTIWIHSLLIGVLAVGVEAFHHLMYNFIGFTLVGVISAIMLLWVALKLGNYQPTAKVDP